MSINQSSECCPTHPFYAANRNYKLQIITVTNEKLKGLGLVQLKGVLELQWNGWMCLRLFVYF